MTTEQLVDGEEQKEKARHAVAQLYLELDESHRLLMLWRKYGREILDEAVTDYLEERIVPRLRDPVKPERFQLKQAARKLVDSYLDLRRKAHPISDFIWRIIGKILGWPKEIPLGKKIFR